MFMALSGRPLAFTTVAVVADIERPTPPLRRLPSDPAGVRR